MTTTESLFHALVDDAGLFPPTALPMDAAVARHRADLEAHHPVHTGRFLVPASRVPELADHLTDEDRFDVGVILDEPLDRLAIALERVGDTAPMRLTGIELRLPQGDPDEAAESVVSIVGDPGVPVYVEIPLAGTPPETTSAALAAVHRRGLGAKVRCGGVRPDLFPATDALAAFVENAVGAGATFKCTAGLHHAVRYVDPQTGFAHHGFLNIIVAVLRAVSGDADRASLVAALSEDDGTALADETRSAHQDARSAARSAFAAYGSCSTSVPLEDLADLGLSTPFHRS